MLRMRLGLFGMLVLGGLGALFLFPLFQPSLALADPINQDALAAASAASGAGLFISDLSVSVPVVQALAPAAAPAAQIALAATATATAATPRQTAVLTTSLASPTLVPASPTTAASATAPRGTAGPSSLPTITRTPAPPTNTFTPRPAVATAVPATQPPPPPPTQPPAPAATAVPRIVGGDLTSCGDITNPGTYRLAASISSRGGDCLNVRASNVVLDCQNQTVAGVGFIGNGITIRRYGLLNSTAPANVEIRNCRVSQFKNGIVAEGGSGLSIHNNDVSNNEDEVDGNRFGIFLGMAESSGIRLNSVLASRVENNTANKDAIGIDVRGSSGVQVRGNTANGNSAWGIHLNQTTGSTVADNTTADNLRNCTWGAGTVGPGCDAGGIILQNGSSGNTVTHNRVTGQNGNGIFIKAHGLPCGDGNTISNNTIIGALYNGIELSFCKNNVLSGNEIASSLDGIWIGYVTSTTVRDNNIHDNRNHGIIALNSRSSEISNNTLTNDREGIYAYSEKVNPNEFWWFNATTYRSEKNCICNNQVFKNGTSGIHLNGTVLSQINSNTLRFNNLNMWFEGDSDGNVIQGNIQQAFVPPAFAWLLH